MRTLIILAIFLAPIVTTPPTPHPASHCKGGGVCGS